MFEIRLSYQDEKLDVFSLKCINCKIETGLDSETSFSWLFDEVITKKIKYNISSCWYVMDN